MELFRDVPSVLGPRPVWLTFLSTAADWRSLVEDDEWDRLIERERRPFGLMTASSDPKRELSAWSDFTDYCVERELMLAASWGANSTVLDDLFDEAAVGRSIRQLPASEPLTTWHDDEPLEEALEFFLGSNGTDLRRDGHQGTDWVRVVIAVNNERWRDQLRAALFAARGIDT
jgi:hypothetical protein